MLNVSSPTKCQQKVRKSTGKGRIWRIKPQDTVLLYVMKHNICTPESNSNNEKTPKRPGNRAFQFFKPTKSQPKSAICILKSPPVAIGGSDLLLKKLSRVLYLDGIITLSEGVFP